MAEALPDGQELLAVADGLGGHAAGAVASALALETLVERLRAGDDLTDAVQGANRAVHGAGNRTAAYRGMGTTLVALLRADGGYRIANVGDSRAYRVAHDGIRQLTLDHSFVAEAERVGGLSSGDAVRSPWRNALTRALGTEPEVEVDVFGPFEAKDEPHVVVLCSDGVYKAVADDAIRECILVAEDAQTAASALTALALRNGSDDNMTVALMEVGSVCAGPETAAVANIPLRVWMRGRTTNGTPPPVDSSTPVATPDDAQPGSGVAMRHGWGPRKSARNPWADLVFLLVSGALLLGLGLYLASL